MKIGMLIPEFPTQTHVFFWREMQALRSLGHEVLVISTRQPQEACPHDFGRIEGPRTHYVYPPAPSFALRGLANPRGLPSALAYVAALSTPGARKRGLGFLVCAADLAAFARKHGIDHVHVHSCAEAAHVAALAFKLGGPRYSLHLHGDLKVYGSDHALKMRDAVFVAAAAEVLRAQIVQGGGIPMERTCRMIMGVDMASFSVRPSRPQSGPLHMVSISRLALCKGHRFGLEAMRRAIDAGADIEYTIAGSGSDEDEIRRTVAQQGLEQRVTFAGALSQGAVAELLARADVFLLSSSGAGEASPVAVMESMARGVPAICSVIGGTADMIDDGEDGLLVAQEDVAGLASAMLRLHADRDLLMRLGQGARARAERDFDALKLARQFVLRLERGAVHARD